MFNSEFLGRKLESSEAEERREAALELGRAGREAMPLLFRAMGDADWRVRKTVVGALVAIGGTDVISGLIGALFAHDNAGSRNSAIEALIQIGTESVNALLAAMDTPDPDVRKFIIDILGDIRDPRAVPSLIARLKGRDENIRVAAAESLGKIGDRRAVDALMDCLTSYEQGWLDYAAAEALGEIGDERALGPLLAALGRSSLREPVLESLGKIGNVRTLDPLIAGLADPLRIVREVSITALVTIHRKSDEAARELMIKTVRAGATDRAVDFLEDLLITSEGNLQKAVIMVLGWAGRQHSIQKLLSLLKEEELEEPLVRALLSIDDNKAAVLLGYLSADNELVRRVAAKVLGEAREREAEGPLISLLSDESGHVRSTAAVALGRLRSGKAIQPLLDLLQDEYENVQEAAIHALAAIGDESVLDGLVKDFSSRPANIRRNIAMLLGMFATDRATEALIFALKDEEPAVRKAVVHALGNAAGGKSLRPLMLAVTDDDPEVRMMAAEALGKTEVREANEALVSLLEDNDLWVRATAAKALGGKRGAEAGDVLVKHLNTATDIFLLALVDVVGGLRLEQALEPLLKLSGHDDPEVRKHVLDAFDAYPWQSVRAAVLARLSDPHWSVRKAAVELLRQKRDPAVETLLERLADGDPDKAVRQAAKEALGR